MLAKDNLLSADVLVNAIARIESVLPGWWWYLAQEKNSVYFHTGPGRNSPYPSDVVMARTAEGDCGWGGGFLMSVEEGDQPFIFWIDKQITTLVASRQGEVPSPLVNFRFQNKSYLERLHFHYQKLLDDLPMIGQHGYLLETVHLGSCDHSADCSLRGRNARGEEFDITIDIEDVGHSIGDSLCYALTELKNDILTSRS